MLSLLSTWLVYLLLVSLSMAFGHLRDEGWPLMGHKFEEIFATGRLGGQTVVSPAAVEATTAVTCQKGHSIIASLQWQHEAITWFVLTFIQNGVWFLFVRDHDEAVKSFEGCHRSRPHHRCRHCRIATLDLSAMDHFLYDKDSTPLGCRLPSFANSAS